MNSAQVFATKPMKIRQIQVVQTAKETLEIYFNPAANTIEI